jgi:hypothetical protein
LPLRAKLPSVIARPFWRIEPCALLTAFSQCGALYWAKSLSTCEPSADVENSKRSLLCDVSPA